MKANPKLRFEGLKIGYDGKRAVCNNTGIGNYSRYLIDAMSLCYPKNEYILYSPKYKDNAQLKPLLERTNISLVTPSKSWKIFGSVWRSLEMTRRMIDDSVSIVHGLSNELPLNIARSGLPSVVTIHDLIWRKIPQNYSAIDRKIFDLKYSAAAHNATRVIAISECTKRDLINDFDVDPSKIDVIYQGCNPIFGQPRDAEKAKEIKALYSLPETYIICVGTVEYRKNQMLSVKALGQLPEDIHLVIVGGKHKDYAKTVIEYVNKHGLSNRVHWLQNVPTEHLPYLYAMANVCAYPSRYEGFGLPIIEALSTGTPVIAATGSCLEEAGGNGAIYVDPDDVDDYVTAANRLIGDTYYNQKYAKAGLQYIKRFNMADFARSTMDTYTKAIFDALQSSD